MKVIIDEAVCTKHKLTLQEVLIALAIRNSSDEVLDNMVAREILVKNGNEYLITQHWNDVVDEIICDSSNPDDEERLRNLAKKMQECYPQGKMPGTPYYYKCNVTEIVRKLKKFFLTYGNYPDERIVDATKRFVASYNGNYRFLPLIKYFISKLKPQQEESGEVHNVEYSPLADYLENKESENTINADNDDWLMSARN